MNLLKTVVDVHKSDIYGTFIEIGCGMPLASKLFEVEGASKTISEAISPYSKTAQSYFLFNMNPPKDRSVSYNFIKEVIDTYWTNNGKDDMNTIFVSSFQLGKDICSHGWIGYQYKDKIKYYHITLPGNLMKQYERKWVIQIIGDISFQILRSRNTDLTRIMYCDMIMDNDGNFLREEVLKNLHMEQEGFLTFVPEQKMCRLEEVIREFPENKLCLYKGSFNPPHSAHIKAAEVSEEFIGHKPVFMISIDTYGKEPLGKEEVLKRVDILNHLGYFVLVCKSGYYNDNITSLRIDRNYNGEIFFVVGGDTLERIVGMTDLTTHQPILDANYICINRPGVETHDDNTHPLIVHPQEAVFDHNVSSTIIRKAFEEDDTRTLEELLPYDYKMWKN